MDELLEQLERDGYARMPGVVERAEVERIVTALEKAFAAAGDDPAILGPYGVRNVVELWPEADVVWRQPALVAVLRRLLGPKFGLVRTLYFDKPPGQSWALPWHKDLTIAVCDNSRPSERFTKPTRKAGVPHVEAPVEVLEEMVTARLHLDEVTEENGPLKVLPGSQRTGKELRLGETEPVTLGAERGEVLLMRPLLVHSSGLSRVDTKRHRRILHFEFAAREELPEGYAWHRYLRG